MKDPDSELVAKAKRGDFAAFEQLVERHQRRIYNLARRIVRQPSDAEEVVQETLLSVIEHLDDFREEAKFATWLARVATNHALKLLRKRQGQLTAGWSTARNEDDDYRTVPHPAYIARWRDNPERLAQQKEIREMLAQALDELDEKYRMIFVLRDIEGLSTREAAEALGITETNAKVRLLRARLMLRERLTQALGDESTRLEPHRHNRPG